MTEHDTKFACTAAEHIVLALTPAEFVAYLNTQAKCARRTKEDRRMFNPAVFQRTDIGNGWRTIANYQTSSMMVLDFDGGNLSPEQFVSIFGPDAGAGRRLSFAIYNSFSRSIEQPNKFHVVVFFSQAATNVKEHKAAYETVVRRLEDEGFNGEGMKLDRCSGVQSFYIPCTNTACPEMAFFDSFWVTARELKRAINPALCLKTAIPVAPKLRNIRFEVERAADDVEAILAPYVGMREGRNRPIHNACWKLRKLNISQSDIKGLIARTFGSEPKVEKTTRESLKSIERYLAMQRGFGSANSAPGFLKGTGQ